jgi:hypothetical protein
MMVRYPIGIALSYLTFLTGVFVWLRLMGLRTNSGRRPTWSTLADAADISWSSGRQQQRWRGGGGGSACPGAAAEPSTAAERMHRSRRPRRACHSWEPANSGSGSASKSGSSLGFDFGDVDGEAIVLLLLAALLVAVVFVTSGYLIWMGPDILARRRSAPCWRAASRAAPSGRRLWVGSRAW